MTLNTVSFDLLSEQDTDAWGKALAPHLPTGFTVSLQGDLGAGKTTLIRAIIRALGVSGPIKSPTFSVVESYDTNCKIHHFDLYRLSDFQELECMGFRDYLSTDAICFIEWPERARNLLHYDLSIKLESSSTSLDTQRRLYLTANTPAAQHILTSVSRNYDQTIL